MTDKIIELNELKIMVENSMDEKINLEEFLDLKTNICQFYDDIQDELNFLINKSNTEEERLEILHECIVYFLPIIEEHDDIDLLIKEWSRSFLKTDDLFKTMSNMFCSMLFIGDVIL